MTLEEMLSALDAEESRTCDACFLECDPYAGNRQYPCSSELREWERQHKDSPGWLTDGEVPK